MHIAEAFFELRTKEGRGWKLLSIISIVLFFVVLLIVYMIPFIYFMIMIYYVFDATGTLSWWWTYAVIAVVVVSQLPNSWIYASRRALCGVVIGLTPQMVFLSLYNSKFIQASPYLALLSDGIKGYDLLLLRLRLFIESVEGYLVYLLAAIIVAGVILSVVYHKVTPLRRGLAAFDELKYVIYVLWIGSVFTFSTSLPAGEWDPDVHSRLKAEQGKILRDTTELQLITALQDELHARNPAVIARYHLMAEALFEERERLRGADANRRAEAAGVRAIASKALTPIVEDMKLDTGGEPPASSDASGEIATYEAERSRVDSLDARVEIAAEALKTVLIEVLSPGNLATALPAPRILQEYLKEAIEESATFIAKRMLAKIDPSDARTLGENALTSFQRSVAARSLAITLAMTTPDVSAGKPRMPQVFQEASARSVREQKIERQVREQERSGPRRR
jgi:hypothetical protein